MIIDLIRKIICNNQGVEPNLNRKLVKTAFFGEPKPNLSRLNLRLLNLNRTQTFNISNKVFISPKVAVTKV